jgi:plastocyanin
MLQLTRFRSIVVVALFAALAATFLMGGNSARAQDSASVDIIDFGFSSADITVEVGATVTWTNTGAATHTVTSDSGAFDSGNLAPGATFSMTFDSAGTFSYFCEIHPSMVGSVTVVDSSGNGGTDNGGTDNGGATDVPATGTGTSLQNHPFNILLLALVAFALAGAGVYQRVNRR